MTTRYVNPNSSGGNGTTNATSGVNAAYASLNAAEAGVSATLTDTWEIVCETGGTADTSGVTFSGITTTASFFLTVYATGAFRHAGIWSTSCYQLTTTASTSIRINHIRLSGLQIRRTNATGNAQASVDTSTIAAGGSDIRITECIIRRTNSGSWSEVGITIGDADATVAVRNCVVYEISSLSGSAGIENTLSTSTIDNCTIISGYYGVRRASGTVVVRNCYASGTNAAYSGTMTKTTCASADTTGDTGLQSIAHSTANFTNVTTSTADYHLVTGSALINVGTDLSGTFTTDIDGTTRTGTWDVGADEYSSAGPTTYTGTVSMAGTGDVTVTGTAAYPGSLALSGTGGQTTTGIIATSGQLNFTSASDMTVVTASGTTHTGVITLSGLADMVLTGLQIAVSQITLSALGGLSLLASTIVHGILSMFGLGTLSATSTSGTVLRRFISRLSIRLGIGL